MLSDFARVNSTDARRARKTPAVSPGLVIIQVVTASATRLKAIDEEQKIIDIGCLIRHSCSPSVIDVGID